MKNGLPCVCFHLTHFDSIFVGDVLSGELVCILSALGCEEDGEITEIAQTDFLAFEELLSHAIYGDVEDGGLAFTERMVML